MTGWTCLCVCVVAFAAIAITERITNYLKVRSRTQRRLIENPDR